MTEEEAQKIMETIKDLETEIAGAKKVVANDVMHFLQMHLNARPDRPMATMKFTDWEKLSKKLKAYGAEI